jgi:lysophospholipase L1-like esterase
VKAQRWLPNALLALGSLLVFGGAAELLCRAVDLRPAGGSALANPAWLGDRVLLRDDYRDEMAKAGVLARYYDLYEWDRFLFYRLRESVDVELLDVFAPPAARERSRWSVHTNTRGFRTPEFADAKPDGAVRIALLGDSSTFGWGVEHFETYAERLGDALAARWSIDRTRIEILNLGVPGYSSFQGRVLLERTGLRLAPDLVVWSYLSNDGAITGEDDRKTYEQRLGATGALLAALHHSRAYETLEAWIGVVQARVAPPAPPDPYDAADRNIPSYRVAAENVRGAVALARAAGVPLVLVGQCTRGEPAGVMARVATETGTPHLDATALLDAAIPALQTEERYAENRARQRARYGNTELEQHPRWLAFLPDVCHPNAFGHRLVGDALAGVVAGVLPAPPAR